MSKIDLSPGTKRKIVAHLKEHWPEPRHCPICRNTSWYLQPGDLIRPIKELVGPDRRPFFVTPAEETIPTIQALCETCFYVHTFFLMPILGEGEDGNG